jgi:hypothetical protein
VTTVFYACPVTSRANPQSLVESFRRAGWIELSLGFRTFGLPRTFIAAVAATWPNAGFRRQLNEPSRRERVLKKSDLYREERASRRDLTTCRVSQNGG